MKPFRLYHRTVSTEREPGSAPPVNDAAERERRIAGYSYLAQEMSQLRNHRRGAGAGKPVRLHKDGMMWLKTNASDAAQFLGVQYAQVAQALHHGTPIKGFKAVYMQQRKTA